VGVYAPLIVHARHHRKWPLLPKLFQLEEFGNLRVIAVARARSGRDYLSSRSSRQWQRSSYLFCRLRTDSSARRGAFTLGGERGRICVRSRRRLALTVVTLFFVGFLLRTGCAMREGTPPTLTSAHHGGPLAVDGDGRFDPDRVDLSGVAGVTPREQANAEDLLRRTIIALERWDEVGHARADGFVSIGDSFSGTEHYVHWDWIEDDVLFDPSRPESLAYRVEPDGQRILEAAMFILPKRYRLGHTPDVGGKFVQFHRHDNLCFTAEPPSSRAQIARLERECTPPLVKLLTNAMLNVWIRPNPCGPFAPIGGSAGGTTKEGESPLCDRVHGSATTG
jgi:hypothetical protein